MKKFLSSFLAILTILSMVIPVSAIENSSEIINPPLEDLSNDLDLETAVQPLVDANKEYYYINDVSFDDISVSEENGNIVCDFVLTLNMTQKANDASQNDFVKGMLNELGSDISSRARQLDTETFSDEVKNHSAFVAALEKYGLYADAPVAYIDNQNKVVDYADIVASVASTEIKDLIHQVSSSIGSASDFTYSVKATYDNFGNILNRQVEGIDEFYPMELFFPRTAAEAQNDAAQAVYDLIDISACRVAKSANEPAPQGNDSFVYNRVDARDYADTYTSTVKDSENCECGAVHDDGSPVTIKKDTTKWNPDYAWYCHNDCANYVSQAMVAGGVETKSPWTPGESAFVSCSGMYNYFYNTKGWWEKSSSSICNAGGIIFLIDSDEAKYHAMMCTKNDGYNRTYSAHTNDKKQATYNVNSTFSSSAVEFYRFTNVNPAH